MPTETEILNDDELLALLADSPPPSPPPQEQPRPAARKKLDLSGIKQKKPKEDTRTEYPELPDPTGEIAQQAEAFLTAHAQEEAAKGAKEVARAALVKAAKPYHFQTNRGRADLQNSVSVYTKADEQGGRDEVLVQFKDAYKKLDDKKLDKITAIIGEPTAGQFIVSTYELSIKSDKIPEDKLQQVVDEVSALAQRLGIPDAVECNSCYKPTAEWHTARYRTLTVEQNLQLEQAVDAEKGFCTVAVTPARGRK